MWGLQMNSSTNYSAEIIRNQAKKDLPLQARKLELKQREKAASHKRKIKKAEKKKEEEY